MDLDGKHGATVVCDIRQWDYSAEPIPDVIFAGVPCEQYSIARTKTTDETDNPDEHPILRRIDACIVFRTVQQSGTFITYT